MKFKKRFRKLLTGRDFSTIRTTCEYKIGDIDDVEIGRKILGSTKVINIETKLFQDFSLEELQADGSYKGYIINNRSTFVNLFHKLTGFLIKPEDELFVITMRWERPVLKVV